MYMSSLSSSSFITTATQNPYNVPIELQVSPQITAPPKAIGLSNPPTVGGLFGPLTKRFCIWFYFLSVVGFVLLVLVLISGVLN